MYGCWCTYVGPRTTVIAPALEVDHSVARINSKGVKRETYLVNLGDFINTPKLAEDYKNLTL